jgi:23S rRNA G2069 N7-methylase RlmK/C1962 C5-methylase RlmI
MINCSGIVPYAQTDSKPYYRLIFGEGDGLPGLVIDRFADVLSVQITTAGIERQKEPLLAVLIELLQPKAILLKNDTAEYLPIAGNYFDHITWLKLI